MNVNNSASSPSRDGIDTLCDRIQTSNDIAGADREQLLAFHDHLDSLAQTYSDYRHEKRLRHCTIMAETLSGSPLAAALDDRKAAEEIVARINRAYDNEETNRDDRRALHVIAEREVDDDAAPPPSFGWVPTGTPSDSDPFRVPWCTCESTELGEGG